MAHKRKDTLTPAPEWWKHLRPFGKRRVSKAERRAAKVEIELDLVDPLTELGLQNDPKDMLLLRTNSGESVIPRGIYCYDTNGLCPYWDKAEKKDHQLNGFCWLLMRGDWDDTGMGELWDQCKCCGCNKITEDESE